MNQPKVTYDAQSDVLYFLIQEGTEDRFEEVATGVFVELGEAGEPLGIEVWDASGWLRRAIGPQRLGELAAPGYKSLREQNADYDAERPGEPQEG